MSKNYVIDLGKKSSDFRGTIIADSSSLIRLASDMPHGYDNCLCFLKFLSKNGFDIIIPEMVAFESSGYLATGDMGDLLNKTFDSGNEKHKYTAVRLRSLLSDAILPEKSPHKEYPNIKIVSSPISEEIDILLDGLKKVRDDYRDALNNVKNDRSNNDRNSRYGSSRQQKKRQSERALWSTYKNRMHELINGKCQQNYGDDAIISLINSHNNEIDHAKPIFVLSDDKGLNQRVKYDTSAGYITTELLTYSLIKAGFSKELGIDNADPSEVEKERRILHERFHCDGDYQQAKKMVEQEYSILGDPEKRYKNFIDKGFPKLLEKLKYDLDKGKNAGSSESSQGHNGGNGESQVEKFLKRYGNRQASSINR